jgi:2-polyprenyl-3-methyl-5-hydroxy-6-metoxy-1,4-benzoquinol methylase
MVPPMRQAPRFVPAHAEEVGRGDRFEFGKNWQRFLNVLDEERVVEAELSIQQMLGVQSLEGRRFLDIGSGSGLFSLAARRLGADRVHSFDFDPSSVACTRELKRRYFADDLCWRSRRAASSTRST